MLKKFLATGMIAGALLAGCGSPAGTGTDTGTGTGGAAATAATSAEGQGTQGQAATAVVGAPTAEAGDTGAANTGDASVDVTAQAGTAANATAVTGAGANAEQATATGANDDTRTTGPGGNATQVVTTPQAGGEGTGTSGTAVATPQAGTGTSGNTSGSTGAAPTAPASWQAAGVPDLGLSFQVPQGFEKLPNENTWTPAGEQLPAFGVETAEVTSDWRPSTMLPEGATVISTEYLNLPSGQAQVYTVENSDGTAESHAIIRSGTTAYDFFARAESREELQTVQPVLSQIVGSVQLGGV